MATRIPPQEMTPDERARLTHELKQTLQRELAKREARGEVDDRKYRIARLAEQKLQSMGVASSRDR